MAAIEGVVSIQNHGTSGSTLMQSLLDFHPNVLSLPGLHGHTLYMFWEQNGKLPAAELLERFLERYAYWYDPSLVPDTLGLQQMGPERDQPTRIDREAFRQALVARGWDASEPLKRSDYIASIYLAYAQALGRTLNQPSYWVVFPIHSHTVTRAKYLIEDFPKAFFLHTTREPIQNMGSGAKHIMKEPGYNMVYLLEANAKQIFLEQAVHVRANDVRGVHAYAPDSADGRIQSRAIRLEDMHNDVEGVMRAVAEWLGIAWNPSLLQSTYDGKLWHNRPTSIRQSGVGNATIQQKHSEIFNRFDRWRLRQIGRPLFVFYRYGSEKDDAAPWVRRWLMPLLVVLPFKVEWSIPHITRAYSLIHKRVDQSSLANRLIRTLRMEKLKPAAVTTAAGLIAVLQTVLGYLRARLALWRIWAMGFSETHGFVPLLYYPSRQTARVSEKKAA